MMLFVAKVTVAREPFCDDDELESSHRYHQVGQTACHNCFESDDFGDMGEVLDTTYAIELDIWDSKWPIGGGSQDGDWYVNHTRVWGNDNICGNGDENFSVCLADVKTWHKAHEGHSVLTIFIDKKQGWGTDRKPADLDKLLKDTFADADIVRPQQLRDGEHSLRTSVEDANTWPTMDDLHNKLIFVITGGNDLLAEYVDDRGRDAFAFVAPSADSEAEVSDPPEFSEDQDDWVVFFNLNQDKEALIPYIHQHRYVVRMWDGDEDAFCEYLEHCVNFSAFDHWTSQRCHEDRRRKLDFHD